MAPVSHGVRKLQRESSVTGMHYLLVQTWKESFSSWKEQAQHEHLLCVAP